MPPTNPTSFAGKTDMVAADLSTPGKAARAIEDRPERPVAGGLVAVETDVAGRERGERRQEAHDGAGEADVDVSRADEGGRLHPPVFAGVVDRRAQRA